MTVCDLLNTRHDIFLFTIDDVIRAKISLCPLEAGVADVAADHCARAFEFAGLRDDRADRAGAENKYDVVLSDPCTGSRVLADGEGFNEGCVLPRNTVADLIYIRFFNTPVFSPAAVCSGAAHENVLADIAAAVAALPAGVVTHYIINNNVIADLDLRSGVTDLGDDAYVFMSGDQGIP